MTSDNNVIRVPPPGTKLIVYCKEFTPRIDQQMKVFRDVSGWYDNTKRIITENPSEKAFYQIVILSIGYGDDYSAYWGLVPLNMPISLAIEAISQFGDKLYSETAKSYIPPELIEGLYYNG